MLALILATLLFLVLAWALALKWTLRAKKASRRKVVIVGSSGAGKTRLFVSLSSREDRNAGTLHSLETHGESRRDGVCLIDTASADAKHMDAVLNGMEKQDTLIYVLGKNEDLPLLKPICSVIYAYPGDSGPSPSMPLRPGDALLPAPNTTAISKAAGLHSA